MFIVGWLGIAFAAYLLDAAVTGRPPLATLKTIVTTGAIPAKPAKVALAENNYALTGQNDPLHAAAQQPPGYVAGTTVQGPTTAGANGTNYSAASQSPDSNPWPAAPAPGTYSGNLDGWINQAITVLESNGTPPDQINVADIQTIIQYESGGNPYAINNYDVNAVNGHPSIGLMQTIRSTFNGYALPGHYDIWNPVDNIVAAVRYAQAQYGSLEQVPGIISVHNGGPYVPY